MINKTGKQAIISIRKQYPLLLSLSWISLAMKNVAATKSDSYGNFKL
jgi:hypothetical protein